MQRSAASCDGADAGNERWLCEPLLSPGGAQRLDTDFAKVTSCADSCFNLNAVSCRPDRRRRTTGMDVRLLLPPLADNRQLNYDRLRPTPDIRTRERTAPMPTLGSGLANARPTQHPRAPCVAQAWRPDAIRPVQGWTTRCRTMTLPADRNFKHPFRGRWSGHEREHCFLVPEVAAKKHPRA